MTASKALGAGLVAAAAVLFGQNAYAAVAERRALTQVEAELSLHRHELDKLTKDLESNRSTVSALETQHKSAGAELSTLQKELDTARAKLKKLESDYADKVASHARARELLQEKTSLIGDLTKLKETKLGRMETAELAVEAQAQKVAAADQAANPLNHPLVQKFFK